MAVGETSGQAADAYNFSRDEHYEHGIRYQRAREFAEVVVALWDSWDDDAFIRDKDSGIFLDPTKMHALNHKGDWFSVRGPLNVPRTPQGRPGIVQAGGSEDMIRVAAEFAGHGHRASTQPSALTRRSRTRGTSNVCPGRNPDFVNKAR